ncbi:hypothetical protein K523DRAFT_361082 [Schizophyllum commune Tattone D]|nr:hypothetical protein K523DRAFT_361082 [Schizophyllum commune Tattone D]
MALLHESQDGSELNHLWQLITELSEQLNENRSLSVSLYTTAADIKNQAVHSQNGFVLRRFNLDKSQEEYDAELEQMNQSMAAENQALAHDNKQLSGLIKEYESTLDTLMTNFRNRAQDVQDHELSLVRSYEEKLLQLEEDNAKTELQYTTELSNALARLGQYLRGLSRLEGGEPVEGEEDTTSTNEPAAEGPDEASVQLSAPKEDEDGQEPNSPTFEEVMVAPTSYDHALQREIELARLEQENAELRRMLGLLPSYPLRGPQAPPTESELAHRPQTAFEAGRTFERQGEQGRPPATFDPVGQGRGMPAQRGNGAPRGNTAWGLLRWE